VFRQLARDLLIGMNGIERRQRLINMDLADIVSIGDAGSKIAGAVTGTHGFVWALGKTHTGHPGNAARGAFVKGDRQLELGFSTDSVDAFRHLARDLQRFGGDFMFGDGATIIAASKAKAAIS
jgi:hypothetical protein